MRRSANRSLRRSAAVLAALAAAATMTACAPAGGSASGAETAMEGFLDALRDGDYATALTFTTAAMPECGWMADSGPAPIAAPTITSIVEDGDAATATVDYRAPDAVTQEFALERTGDQWRVVLPDSYRMTVTFDAPVVADVRLTDRSTGTECDLPVRDASLETFAWPGMYEVSVIDPSGVLPERLSEPVFVADTPGLLELEAVPASALADVSARAFEPLSAAYEECVASGLQGNACPLDVTAAAGANVVTAPTGAFSTIARLWTDDGLVWRFETAPDTITVSDAAGARTLPFVYTGTVSGGPDGALDLDTD